MKLLVVFLIIGIYDNPTRSKPKDTAIEKSCIQLQEIGYTFEMEQCDQQSYIFPTGK